MDSGASVPSKRVLFEDDAVVVDDEEFALRGQKIVTVEDACRFLEMTASFYNLRIVPLNDKGRKIGVLEVPHALMVALRTEPKLGSDLTPPASVGSSSSPVDSFTATMRPPVAATLESLVATAKPPGFTATNSVSTARPPPATSSPAGQQSPSQDLALHMSLPAARVLPNSELTYEKELGQGAFGVVYRVLHKQLGGIYAAKVLKIAQGEMDTEALREFLAETALLASLRDPHLVSFLGTSITSKNMPVLITEFMHGGSLASWLYQRSDVTITQKQQLQLATDIAAGLAFLHSVNVVHRDMKSDNVLLNRDGTQAKVGDIGLAKVRSSGSVYMTEMAGTCIYMAPEMLCREKYGAGVDVYAFALVLYELYSRQRPYPLKLSNDINALRAEVATKGTRPSMPNSVPAAVTTLVSEAWCGDQRSRPSMVAVLHRLRAIDATEAGARGPSLNATAGSWQRTGATAPLPGGLASLPPVFPNKILPHPPGGAAFPSGVAPAPPGMTPLPPGRSELYQQVPSVIPAPVLAPVISVLRCNQWGGMWVSPLGYKLDFVLTLRKYPDQGSGDVDGVIAYRCVALPKTSKLKIGKVAHEEVRGTYNGATNSMFFTGYKVDDTKMLAPDDYRIRLSSDHMSLEGESKGQAWENTMNGSNARVAALKLK